MAPAKDRHEVRLAGVTLGRARHICALFHDRDAWYETLLPFIQEGLQLRDKAFHIIDGQRWAEHLDRLRQAGIDVEAAQRSGQLEVAGWREVEGGYERHEVIGRNSSELRLWADPEERAGVIERLVRDGVVREHETRFRKKSGEIRDALLTFVRTELRG